MTPRKGTGGLDSTPSSQPPSRGIGISGGAELPKDTSLDDRSRLEALRALLEGILNNSETPPRDVAAVSREYRQCLTALGQLAPAAAGTPLDELRARRRKRGTS